MTQTHPLNDRLKKARIHLLLDHPFFGTLAMRLENVMDPGIKTTSTNGKVIRWNPTYLAGLTDAQVRGIMAHDVLHVANGHTWRRGSRDETAWNTATDKTVNGILDSAGLELPDGEIKPMPHEAGKAAETLYQAPPPGNGSGGGNQDQGQGQQNPPPPAPGGGQGKGKGKNSTSGAGGGGTGQPQAPQQPGCGAVEDAPADQAKDMEAEWKVAVVQAAEAAKSQGNLPGDLQRMVDDIVDPKVPWEVLLRDFVERTARNDFNWSRPNRRYMQGGFVLPSLLSEELPAIVVAVDTSGSIGKTELDQFASEISAVLGAYETTIHVIYVDTRVASHEVVTRADLPLNLKAYGGGGTDFRPAFQWVEKEDVTPACLIYLTDGYGVFPEQEAEYPTLWVMTSDMKAPHGETVWLGSGADYRLL